MWFCNQRQKQKRMKFSAYNQGKYRQWPDFGQKWPFTGQIKPVSTWKTRKLTNFDLKVSSNDLNLKNFSRIGHGVIQKWKTGMSEISKGAIIQF